VGVVRKYRLRRVTQLRNLDIRGVFIGNAHREVTPARRPDPFTAQLVEDAERDGDLLMTTWDLFRVIQSVAARELRKDDARKLISESRGRFHAPERAKSEG
jgi:hypothetical protein